MKKLIYINGFLFDKLIIYDSKRGIVIEQDLTKDKRFKSKSNNIEKNK